MWFDAIMKLGKSGTRGTRSGKIGEFGEREPSLLQFNMDKGRKRGTQIGHGIGVG